MRKKAYAQKHGNLSRVNFQKARYRSNSVSGPEAGTTPNDLIFLRFRPCRPITAKDRSMLGHLRCFVYFEAGKSSTIAQETKNMRW